VVFFATIHNAKSIRRPASAVTNTLLETLRQEIKGQSDPSSPQANAAAQRDRSLGDDAENRLATMQLALAVTISLGQTDPAVAADMGPRPEQRLMWPGRFTNKPVNPGDTAVFDTDAD
tara:strand:- start:171 stop:524 length:354 start_codon:yes stop_codon:yes gene_type:complete